MRDIVSLLGALQHADSFFPSGAVSFSSGLEPLFVDRELASATQLGQFVEGQLVHRWAGFDAAFLVAAHRAGGDLEQIAELDAQCEAMTLATELREGSRRAGVSLLSVHAKLGTAGAEVYKRRVANQQAQGHLPIAQGLVWQAAGIGERDCRAVSAHGFATGLVSAGLRLGLVGHLDAQRILAGLRPLVAQLLAADAPEVEDATAYAPATEIAAMRHETMDARMFAN